jgi:signal transduction histidine kinase
MTTDKSKPSNIMAVDDTPANLKLLDGMLREWGYQVRAFPRGRLALAAALNEPPDLILLDITMPEMDGYETCRQFKAIPALQQIPIIFISALNEALDKVNAFGCGGVDYVTKPFQLDEVHARIETHLKIRQLQKALEIQNQQLRENYDRLHALEILRDNLTHMIIHDMRSPLMAISGNLELLSEEIGALPENSQLCLEDASTATHKLTEMVSSLLDVSRLESGQMPIQRTSCDLQQVVQKVIATLSSLLKNNPVVVEAQSADPTIECDPTLLHRVIGNLLSNAAKFSPRTEPVTISFHNIPGFLKVTVRDQGRGIPPEYHARIFEKFGQVSSENNSKRYSTGLGLTFCKLAIEAHGGQIGIESSQGKGSTFWLTLPRRPAENSL